MGTAAAPHRQGESMSLSYLGSRAYFTHFRSQKHQQREREKCLGISSVKPELPGKHPEKYIQIDFSRLSVHAYRLKTVFSGTVQAQTYKQVTMR